MSEEVLGQIAEDLGDNEVRLAYGEELAKLDFALALAKARKESDLTQQQLAEQLGVSQAYVARLESGLANPTVGKVGSIFASLWKRPSISLDSLVRQKEQIASLPNGLSVTQLPRGERPGLLRLMRMWTMRPISCWTLILRTETGLGRKTFGQYLRQVKTPELIS